MQVKTVAAYLLIISFVVALLIVGKPFLVPFFLALVVWYLINAIHSFINQIAGERIPNWMGLTAASLLLLSFLILVGNLITTNIESIIAAAPEYRVNIEEQLRRLLLWVGLKDPPTLAAMAREVDLNTLLRPIINSVTGTASSFILILIYVIFLLVEQGTFMRKLAALQINPERRVKLRTILRHTNQAIRTFLTVKVFTSFLTGLLSYFIIEAVGVEFALFWAFLIFVLNFIPTIGSIIATAFPALQTLVQFDAPMPFVIVLFGVIAVQILVGSIMEPRLMGNSLNISPLVVILSLVIWGFIWGVVGMLLCVPITVIMIIVFAQFPNTRGVAILLSRNGAVDLEIQPLIRRARKPLAVKKAKPPARREDVPNPLPHEDLHG